MLEVSVSQLWRTGSEWLSIDPPLPADVKSLKFTCKLSHNLLSIEGKAPIGDLVSWKILLTFKDFPESLLYPNITGFFKLSYPSRDLCPSNTLNHLYIREVGPTEGL